jgi:hypothetical protein
MKLNDQQIGTLVEEVRTTAQKKDRKLKQALESVISSKRFPTLTAKEREELSEKVLNEFNAQYFARIAALKNDSRPVKKYYSRMQGGAYTDERYTGRDAQIPNGDR